MILKITATTASNAPHPMPSSRSRIPTATNQSKANRTTEKGAQCGTTKKNDLPLWAISKRNQNVDGLRANQYAWKA